MSTSQIPGEVLVILLALLCLKLYKICANHFKKERVDARVTGPKIPITGPEALGVPAVISPRPVLNAGAAKKLGEE